MLKSKCKRLGSKVVITGMVVPEARDKGNETYIQSQLAMRVALSLCHSVTLLVVLEVGQ